MKNVYIVVIGFIWLSSTVWANGKIEAVGGPAGIAVMRDGKTLVLKVGALLNPGDELSTVANQAVDLRFKDRSLVRLGGSTQYRIGPKPHPSPWRDYLLKGFVRVLAPQRKKAEKGGGPVKLHIDTPTGTIGVRGTEFTVKVSGGVTELYALHGAVLFGSEGAAFKDINHFVVVLRGYQSLIRKQDKKPTLPTKFDLNEYIRMLDSKSSTNPLVGLSERRTGEKAVKVAEQSKESSTGKKMTAVNSKEKKKQKSEATKTLEEEMAALQKDLLEAVRNDDVETVEKLMNEVGGEGIRLNTGDSMLHVAAVYDSHLTMQYLIDHGLNVDIQNPRGETPLMYVAGKSGVAETALLLLQNGADPKLENKDKKSAIDMAKEADHEDILKLLDEEVNRHKDD